ncbi:GHKL domain-containing protein [Staphylococcus simiae]|uniref:quorum-sensing sensor histidine kinase AgrC n=1 Tax=Staphylococcus simiae TaxID=308354 RepID=UPI001A965BB3|nr:GHKL domain-containing protein [Staphylococcus simiae]MBO1198324.1 GHKL domain-containing protein [Staphylococcus simiae]MBO1200384.1 GHKL domain-containing protein [Staphylococcus simiae]MBO1202657.1 GHKL domain-containing protein [Staphylococcus simiae]MBO1210316.1 GHKL domain-containing protein [Staphylococcus simiae]MBO1228769.1 GHKL domain-containing protein [Staphylococcus simiae]
MEVLNFFPLAIFQIILTFIVTKIISDIKYKKRDYAIILAIIIPSTILYYFFGNTTLIFVFIAMLVFFYTKIKAYAIITVLISQLIMYMTNYINLIVFLYILSHYESQMILLFIYILIFSIVPIILSFIIKFIIERLKNTYLASNKLYLSLISIVIFFILGFFYTYSQIDSDKIETVKAYTVVFLGVILFLSVLVFVFSQFTLKEMKYKRNQEEIETYYEYTLRIEAINNEMRKFRHDYINILSTLSEYIREDDMPGLRQYFNQNIVPMKDNIQMNAIKLNGIENLKIREIKGLITAKILLAQEMNIPISIEVPEEMNHIDMNMIDLSRSIGIILDNAIEASNEIDDPIIRVAFLEDNGTITFIVMNKCRDDIPRIHELFQENFSTKGQNRGLGLSTLKEIADKSDNVLLDTTIENGFFIQKVEIINNQS